MWTTKETKREYRGIEIVKYEGSKMKDFFRKRDPRTFQRGDSMYVKWHSYDVNINDVKHEFEKLKDAKEFIDSILNKNEKTL
jgi:hypothetical protein